MQSLLHIKALCFHMSEKNRWTNTLILMFLLNYKALEVLLM